MVVERAEIEIKTNKIYIFKVLNQGLREEQLSDLLS
jgi:hypothetical protein